MLDCSPVIAPYFSLARGEWVPYVLTWDAETGEFRGVEGPRGFATYREALEASRFLTLTTALVTLAAVLVFVVDAYADQARIKIAPDALVGCRSPEEPGCNT